MSKGTGPKPLHIGLFAVTAILAIILYMNPVSSYGEDIGGFVQLIRSILMIAALYLGFQKIVKMELHTKILIAMVVGGFAGFFFQGEIAELKPIGTAFIRMIQMIVVPLVLASLLVGTASLGDMTKMKRIGGKTLAYYLTSTAVAITVGLLLANVFQPGSSMPQDIQDQLMAQYQDQANTKVTSAAEKPSYVETFLDMIPANPFAAFGGTENDGKPKMLQIIFFAIFCGIALTYVEPKKAQPVIDFFDGITETMIKVVLLVMEIAPYGVFALIAEAVGSFGVDIILALFKYTTVTAAGLGLMIAIYPFVVKAFTGKNPVQYLKDIRPAQLIAFSTSSSGATLPVTMEVCEDNVGVSKEISSFVLPLGATVNMDGTALYQGVAAVFIAQVLGIDLSLADQLIIVLTATLASIGTAAVPGVGIIMLVIVLQQLGIPLEGIALILAVDRLLDMIRTVVNVTSDATAATIISASEGQLKQK